MGIASILTELKQIEHGFKHIMQAGDLLFAQTDTDHFALAKQLLTDESYQGRMLGTYLLGLLAPKAENALALLKHTVANDGNWRVQEMLAKAFDHYCSQIGYEQALPAITSWLSDPNAQLNRAVVEGLRIWTGRPYFKQHPEKAISLIAQHKNSESEYLRKAVGNALRDISKKHKALIVAETSTWNLDQPRIAFTRKLIGEI